MHTPRGSKAESTHRVEVCLEGPIMQVPETRADRQCLEDEESGGMRKEVQARTRIEQLVHMLV